MGEVLDARSDKISTMVIAVCNSQSRFLQNPKQALFPQSWDKSIAGCTSKERPAG
jgi:hypothetical protein